MTSRTAVGLLLLLIPACLQVPLFENDAEATRDIHSVDVMKQTILAHVPAGTSAKQARRFLEKEGFKVEKQQNSTFEADGVEHQNVDFLLCTRTDHAGEDVVEINWQIAVALRGEVVGDVWISTDLLELPTLPVSGQASQQDG